MACSSVALVPGFGVVVPGWDSSEPSCCCCCSLRAPSPPVRPRLVGLPSRRRCQLPRVLQSALPSPPPPSSSPAGRDGSPSPSNSLSPSSDKGNSDGEVATPVTNTAQSALDRAMAYKKRRASTNPNFSTPSQPPTKPPPPPPRVPPDNSVEVEILAGKPIQSKRPPSVNADDAGSIPANSTGGGENLVSGSGKAEDGKDDGSKAIALSALGRAQAYKLQQSEMIAALNAAKQSGSAGGEEEEEEVEAEAEEEKNVVEIEIHTRDGIVRRKVLKPETAFGNVRDLKRKGVSTLDFVGLGFADKKSSTSRPAGLRESFEAPSGPLPEVEMLTRDANVADLDAMVDGGDVYKPRVTTWGMFPRPADISKAYGGGRNIKPGQKLETEEEKISRESKTRKLLDDHRKKLGLDMAPKDIARCERNFKIGANFMDKGQLREAQAAFRIVMDEMPTASELHGMAALQEAVCLDSLNRSDEAKVKYEKLVSHSNGAVRKKARQLLFGFQAAERLKVRAGYNWDNSSYRKYFDAFADGYNTMYKRSETESADDEESLVQTLPYALLLAFPVLLVITLVAIKHS